MIKKILKEAKTKAIVGLSDNPNRPSYGVGLFLKNAGYEIIPVNPNISSIFGIKAYPSILEIPRDIKIDIVDIFRQPEMVIPIIDEVVKSGRKPVIWMQEGVGSMEAVEWAKKNGLLTVAD